SEYDSLSALIFGANPIIHTVLDFGDSTGYSELSPTTNGEQFDITGSWGANLAAIASQIRALVAGDGNSMGVVWSETVEVTDGETDISAYWDPSGLPVGTYCAWTVSIDQIGNSFTSPQIEVCVTDVDPPVGYVSGFGTSTDEHMVNTRWVYGRTWDTDVASAQVQRRKVTETDDRAWTTMGIGLRVNDDSTCWMAAWNWCLTTDDDYELRWLMTDKAGNETDPADAPRATVNVNGCDVAVIAPSVSVAKVAFEDKTFENLGLVHVNDAATGMHHSMIGVFADMTGVLQVEKIKLWTDQSNSTHLMGTFDDSAILGGGTGDLWVAYNDFDAGITHLGSSMITVYHVEADLGFPGCVSDEVTGAKVCINPGALATNNGVVLLPARLPILALTQQHFQVWPDSSGNVLAARLTSPVSSFMIGKYAEVTIPYVSSLPTEMLTVAWWDGDEWNTTDGMIAGGEIGGGMATVYTTNLHGLYAVVSAGRECNSGALTVKHLDAVKSYNNWVGPMPMIRTVVRSNIEGGNGNGDISESDITVILDKGTGDELVLWTNNEQPDNGYYTSSWDNVTGIVTTSWNTGAPPLSEGDHTLYVLAFNKSGWCQSDTWSFQVDATEPDVDVTTSEVDTDPVFTITITDIGATTDLPGSGVDWDAVYVDVYDVTESEYNVIPKERLIHTETPDAYDTHDLNEATGEFTFTLIDRILSGRRLQIVIYDGDRDLLFNGDCGCEYYVYNHDVDGVPDMVGNHTEVVEEDFTVVDCAGPDCDGVGIVGISSPNPFNPFERGAIAFDLNGFTGRVTVYDLTGERVAMIHNTVIDGQEASVMWNGRTDGDFSTYVAEGVYLVHFQSDGSSANTPTSQVLKVVVQRPN
ncbi:MAG: hypothetical protein IIA44_06725, partial [Acidobacteria bacterium]|nr:hypothetical protein [Acidobacteriota bacterium]